MAISVFVKWAPTAMSAISTVILWAELRWHTAMQPSDNNVTQCCISVELLETQPASGMHSVPSPVTHWRQLQPMDGNTAHWGRNQLKSDKLFTTANH